MSDPQEPTPQQRKSSWFVIFGSFCLLPVILVVVTLVQGHRPLETEPGDAKTIFYILGALGAIAGAIAAKSFDPPPAGQVVRRSKEAILKFQTASIIALALSELSTIFGFIGKSTGNFEAIDLIALVGLNLVVNFLFILPRALAFWKTQVR